MNTLSVNGWRVSIAPCSQPICVRPAVLCTRIVCSTSWSTTTCWCEALKSRLDWAICPFSRSAAWRARSRSFGASSSPSTSTGELTWRRPLSALVGLKRAHSRRTTCSPSSRSVGIPSASSSERSASTCARCSRTARRCACSGRSSAAVGSLRRRTHAKAARATVWRGMNGTTAYADTSVAACSSACRRSDSSIAAYSRHCANASGRAPDCSRVGTGPALASTSRRQVASSSARFTGRASM